ncbi:hypothetical protein CCC_01672 [Paramagnetospirillum magnetotacticum MS-1]|uniref:Uncharacterized protein n=1 Tax=Paramagnetospirillum magnetotacticum MS-1 TaxID=272627 RepID=A0A0C2UVF1_PARME|nr:hypothetical protein CCC_01672 [Paramagnetospirillum magnetotacticum MS-1]
MSPGKKSQHIQGPPRCWADSLPAPLNLKNSFELRNSV